MANHRKKVTGPCSYCNVDRGPEYRLTIDHVIPVCLFPGGRAPDNVPIVYACQPCNNTKKNLDDAYLQQLLVMDDEASSHPIARQIFEGPVTRAIKNTIHKQSPIAQMVLRNQGHSVSFTSPGGIYLGEGFSPDIPPERTQRIFSTIVCGLSVCYANTDIPEGTQYTVFRARGDKKPLAEAAQWLATHGGAYRKVGDGQVFQCLFGVAQDRPDTSVWLLEFYQNVDVVVLATNPDLTAGASKLLT
jgi:hypothetical protein